MADAPFVPFPPPAPSGGFWAKMAQGAQRQQFRAWTVLYVILCAPERTARSKTNDGAAVFSAPRNVRASGLSPPRFLACRRSECRQPDIFSDQLQYVQASEKSRTESRPRAAIVYSRRSGADFCVGRPVWRHSRMSASRRAAVRVRVWAAVRAFARRATTARDFFSPTRGADQKSAGILADTRWSATHVAQPGVRTKNPKNLPGRRRI